MSALRPAVFLDRDGTLIEERNYPVRAADIVPVAGAGAALRRLAAAGYLTIVLTNQSAVARGLIDEEGLHALHEQLRALLAPDGGHLDEILYCPHHPEGRNRAYAFRCRCRKPAPGLLELALRSHPIDLGRSVFIGDSPRDLFVSAGPCAGRILVTTGHRLVSEEGADLVVPSIVEAVDAVLQWAALQGAVMPGRSSPSA